MGNDKTRYEAIISKLRLLGYEILDGNGWAVVFKDTKGDVNILNTTVSNSIITGVFKDIRLLDNFIIVDKIKHNKRAGGISGTTEIYIKGIEKNVLSPVKSLFECGKPPNKNTKVIFGVSSQENGYAINYLGTKLKIDKTLTPRRLSLRTDDKHTDIHYLERMQLVLDVNGDTGYDRMKVVQFTTDLKNVKTFD